MKDHRLRLEAILEQKSLKVSLLSGKEIFGGFETANDRNLSGKLLPLLDKMFRKHNIVPAEIPDTLLKSEMPDTFTSYRIVKLVLDTIGWNSSKFCQGGVGGRSNSTKLKG